MSKDKKKPKKTFYFEDATLAKTIKIRSAELEISESELGEVAISYFLSKLDDKQIKKELLKMKKSLKERKD